MGKKRKSEFVMLKLYLSKDLSEAMGNRGIIEITSTEDEIKDKGMTTIALEYLEAILSMSTAQQMGFDVYSDKNFLKAVKEGAKDGLVDVVRAGGENE